MSKLKGLAWLSAGVAIGWLSVVGLPRLARHTPWSVEERLGSLTDAGARPVACGRAAAPAAVQAAHKVIARLFPRLKGDEQLPVRIEVIPGPDVNAYATLGGRIYVFDGLLQASGSPEELAGVLAHEIEHVRRRHIIQGAAVTLFTAAGLQAVFSGSAATGLTRTFLTMSFSRDQETEADEGGLARLQAAGVDAGGFEAFFTRASAAASPPAWLSSHPSHAERAALAARHRSYASQPVLTPQEWAALRTICR